jgi:hypothetical protein
VIKTIKKIWRKWKRIAEIVGTFQVKILLTILYFLLFAPVGLGVKLFSDMLGLKPRKTSHWTVKETENPKIEDSRRQF